MVLGSGSGGSGVVIVRCYCPGAPVIENRPASNFKATSASFNGHLVTNGSSSASVFVLWGPTDGGTLASAWANTNGPVAGISDNSSVSITVGGLTQDSLYYYTFAVSNAAVEGGLMVAPNSMRVYAVGGTYPTATGGTMSAACSLVRRLGAEIVGLSFLVELDFLRGRARLPDHEIFSLVHYDAE
jgi:hypothetical protein